MDPIDHAADFLIRRASSGTMTLASLTPYGQERVRSALSQAIERLLPARRPADETDIMAPAKAAGWQECLAEIRSRYAETAQETSEHLIR